MYVALYDEERQLISFPYFVDLVDKDVPDPRRWDRLGTGEASGVTGYILRKGDLLHVTSEDVDALTAEHELTKTGAPTSDYLGVPLKTDGHTIGVIAVQSYEAGSTYDEADEQLLVFVADHIATALAKTRASRELRQRNAELAVINEIGEALAKQLDFESIIDAVGERVRDIFGVKTAGISLYDPETGLLVSPYTIDLGERIQIPPLPLSNFTRVMVEGRRTLRFGTADEGKELGAEIFGTDIAESFLGVPILAGDRVLGLISIERVPKDAFSEFDERLLSTIASSMGVALENARLFDETKRLLTETEQRNAELAVINEIGDALAKQLDFEAIIEAVGDKLAEVLDSRDLSIAILDESTKLVSFPYWTENGIRDRTIPELELGAGLTSRILSSGRPLRTGTAAQAEALGANQIGEIHESYLGVPISSGGRVTGVLSISKQPPNAFSQADEQLRHDDRFEHGRGTRECATLRRDEAAADRDGAAQRRAGGHQRDRRGARQAARLPGDHRRVGEKIRSIFDVATGNIQLYDATTNMIRAPYGIDQGQRRDIEEHPLGGLTAIVINERRSLRLGTGAEADALGALVFGADDYESWLGVPILAGDRVLGAVSLERAPQNAFSESDERLLSTIAANLGVALENARLFDETKRLLAETDARAAELAIINDIGSALAKQLDFQAIIELVGERVGKILGNPDVAIALYDPDTNLVTTPYASRTACASRMNRSNSEPG